MVSQAEDAFQQNASTRTLPAESKGDTELHAFFAYPSVAVVADIARASSERLATGRITVHPWEENDIAGRPLIEPILNNIDSSSFVVADITYLNFNVSFEIGYAIARANGASWSRTPAFEATPTEFALLESSTLLGTRNIRIPTVSLLPLETSTTISHCNSRRRSIRKVRSILWRPLSAMNQ